MAPRNKIVIIIDCNWYISASINRKSRRILYKIITNPSFIIVYSIQLLKEYNLVIKRDKFKRFIRPTQANRFLQFLKSRIVEIKPSQQKKISRDKGDDYLLSLAKASEADYLITGDNDLLVLKSYRKTKIITMKQFVEIANL